MPEMTYLQAITDGLRWRLLKKHFLISLEDPVGVEA